MERHPPGDENPTAKMKAMDSRVMDQETLNIFTSAIVSSVYDGASNHRSPTHMAVA